VTVSAKNVCRILLLGSLMPTAISFGAGNTGGKNPSAEPFAAGKDSYRASFDLNVPRRYATRYLKDSRSLEIRVSPARSSEFDVSRYYDSRYIHRVVVEEKNGDVILSFQLKNAPLAWVVAHQDSPWRLVLDVWQTQPVEPRSIDQEWKWQDDATGKVKETADSSQQGSSLSSSSAVRPIEIDLAAEEPLPVTPKLRASTEAAQPASAGRDDRKERLEPVSQITAAALAALERQAGADAGSVREFDSVEKLATTLYRAGQSKQALVLMRRLANLNSRRFQDSPRLLWIAGESAYIDGKADLANDYFQTLVGRFPSHEMLALGQLRLADLKTEKFGASAGPDVSERLTQIAASEKAPWAARIGASVRLLESAMAARPEAARAHQAALQTCLNGQFVSDTVKQSCAYIQTKYAVSQLDAVSADAILQKFRSRYISDARGPVLEAELANRVKFIVDELSRKKDFPALAEFERSARSGLLDFTLREPDLLMARVDGWLSVGESRKALALLQVFTNVSTDESKKNEAFALTAQLLNKLQAREKAEAVLKKIFNSDVRKNTGLSERAAAALKESARAPYSSKAAQSILIDEMKFGRYVEREVGMLVTLANAARGREDADKVFDVLMTTSPRNDDEARRIEGALMGYADDLRTSGRLAKAGDVYMTVANLAQTTKKAEASYKAGLVYARAGMVEKAKSAWQISAADITDKKFSSLASERLERIR
jgi:Tfp pilus assembly protein PilV